MPVVEDIVAPERAADGEIVGLGEDENIAPRLFRPAAAADHHDGPLRHAEEGGETLHVCVRGARRLGGEGRNRGRPGAFREHVLGARPAPPAPGRPDTAA